MVNAIMHIRFNLGAFVLSELMLHTIAFRTRTKSSVIARTQVRETPVPRDVVLALISRVPSHIGRQAPPAGQPFAIDGRNSLRSRSVFTNENRSRIM